LSASDAGKTTVCIHQPDFAPWLGFFERLLHTDVFVILDDVQFVRRGWHHRDRIKTPQGVQWLTLPVIKKGHYDQLIRDTQLDVDSGFTDKHLRTLEMAYGKRPGFDTVFPVVEEIYRRQPRLMIDLNLPLLEAMMAAFGLEKRMVMASSLNIASSSTERLVDIVRAVGGTDYLSGTGARAYLDEQLFAAAGIGVQWQRFDHPTYPQPWGDFEPGLSGLDCLFNCGRDAAAVLRSTQPAASRFLAGALT
jgi:hypothetical protein